MAVPGSDCLFQEVLPKQGVVYQEDVPSLVLCKPKLLPMKSVTLEKLEKMQREAQETVKQQEVDLQNEINNRPTMNEREVSADRLVI